MGERVQDARLSDLADRLAESLDKPRAEVAAALAKALEGDVKPLKASWPPEVETR